MGLLALHAIKADTAAFTCKGLKRCLGAHIHHAGLDAACSILEWADRHQAEYARRKRRRCCHKIFRSPAHQVRPAQ